MNDKAQMRVTAVRIEREGKETADIWLSDGVIVIAEGGRRGAVSTEILPELIAALHWLMPVKLTQLEVIAKGRPANE